jgi:hypothetical protein
MTAGDAIVKLTEAGSEPEAAMICGFLESRGIRATYDKGTIEATPVGAISGAYVGRQEIVVRAEDLAAAREALAEL